MRIGKKLFLGVIFILALGILAYYFVQFNNNFDSLILSINDKNLFHKADKQLTDKKYEVYLYDKVIRTFKDQNDALKYAKTLKRSYIKIKGSNEWIWNNFDSYIVYSKDTYLKDFNNFSDAYEYAKVFKYGKVCYKTSNKVVWDRSYKINQKVKLDVPLIYQYPELPRGCEVTSLAMLLNYKNIKVDKMELAKRVKKATNRNPNEGFVGDMYSLRNFGYGVYHKPIYDLMTQYKDEGCVDLTGGSFDQIYYFLNSDNPVWVVVNSTYKKLEQSELIKWIVGEETIYVSNREHAVLVTGYDEDEIYINDPLNIRKKVNKKDFIDAWEQMGSQAVTCIDIN